MNDRVPGTANRKQGLGLRLTTLYLGPALLLTAIVLPTLLLWNHLQFDSYSWLVVLFGPTFASGWIAFVILSLVIRQTARPMLWESYLQLLYVFGSLFAVALDIRVILNIYQSYIPNSIFFLSSYLFYPIAILASSACAIIATILGNRVAALERAKLSQLRSREVWLSEIQVSLKFWIFRTIFPIFPLCWLMIMMNGGQYFVYSKVVDLILLPAFLLLLLTVGIVPDWTSKGWLSITPKEVRIRWGWFGTRKIPTEKITGVQVTEFKSFSRKAIRRLFERLEPGSSPYGLILRDGPALLIHTVDAAMGNKSSLITTPDAAEAAEVLRGWLAARPNGASFQPTVMQGSPQSTDQEIQEGTRSG